MKIPTLCFTVILILVLAMAALYAQHSLIPQDNMAIRDITGDGIPDDYWFGVATASSIPAGDHTKGYAFRPIFAWDLATTYTAAVTAATLIELRFAGANRTVVQGTPNAIDVEIFNNAQPTSRSLSFWDDSDVTTPALDYFTTVTQAMYRPAIDVTSIVKGATFDSSNPYLIVRLKMRDGNGFVNGVNGTGTNDRVWVGTRAVTDLEPRLNIDATTREEHWLLY